MDYDEADTWVRQATGETLQTLRQGIITASEIWDRRMDNFQEMDDLWTFAQGRGAIPIKWIQAWAAEVTTELAIICQIWPRPIDAVLRPPKVPGEDEYRSWFTPRGHVP